MSSSFGKQNTRMKTSSPKRKTDEKTAMERLRESTEQVRSRKKPQAIAQLRATPMTDEEKAAFLKQAQKTSWVVDPRTSSWMVYWDGAMILALVYTATVSPYQIAFLEPPLILTEGADALWVLNRVTDIFFLLDVFLVRLPPQQAAEPPCALFACLCPFSWWTPQVDIALACLVSRAHRYVTRCTRSRSSTAACG